MTCRFKRFIVMSMIVLVVLVQDISLGLRVTCHGLRVDCQQY